jgi:colanic acid biosynthesis protein WcaH
MLSSEKYLLSLSLTQVVSADLLVQNSEGKFLLGKRINAPAKGYFFVPGGRVYKNENIKQGAYRMLQWELGVNRDSVKLKPRCVSEHMYEDNFAGAKDEKGDPISTHYVCFAFDVTLSDFDESVFTKQHSEAIWASPEEILARDDVHEYVKLYFTPDAYNRF